MFTSLSPARGRPARHLARAAGVAVLLAVSTVACELPAQDSGPVPEGVRRDLPLPGDERDATTAGSVGEPATGTPTPAGPGMLPPPAAHAAVTATPATGEYHAGGCALLAGVGATRSYASAFEAVDAGLAPCTTCNPGP